MAGKSRQRRGKYAYEEKLRKRQQTAVDAAGGEQIAPQVPRTSVPPPVTAHSVATAGTRATAFIARQLHVGGELRRIGLIAGIIVAVLVVLSVTLP